MARENLLLNGEKPAKLEAHQDKGYWEFPAKFYREGIPSALYQLLEAFDTQAVDVAVLVYLTKNWKNIIKFKAELDEAYESIPKDVVVTDLL